jgi:hypothetical protein
VGHEEGRVTALDVAEALREEEGALRAGESSARAWASSTSQSSLLASVAERGDEGPASACGGGDEATEGRVTRRSSAIPDDLLQKWQRGGTFGDLQLPCISSSATALQRSSSARMTSARPSTG